MSADLMERVTSLRAAIAKLRTDVDTVVAAEAELAEALRSAGIDDAITTVDLPTIAGLPSRRKKTSASATPAGGRDISVLKAGAAGAALMLGVSVVILLALNLVRRAETPAPAPVASVAPSSVPTPTPVAIPTPAPVPPPPSASAAPSAPAEPVKPEMGALTILCTPRCDAITDNGIPLSPGNLVGVPVAAGPHRIEARGNGVKRAYNVNVAPNQTRELKILLEVVDRGF